STPASPARRRRRSRRPPRADPGRGRAPPVQSWSIAPYAVCALADKPKTPRPPVQAPKRREEKKQGLSGLPVWAMVVGAIVLIGAVVGIVVAATGGGDSGGGSDKNAE